MKFVGKNVVIYGAGVSGRAVYDFVRDKGAKAIVYDDDENVPFATHSKGVFDSADIIVLSPGVSAQKDFIMEAKLENKLVIGELELASVFCNAEQIAVTGTNGKTTTTLLIDHVLKRAGLHSHAVGNIGVPFCSIADKLDVSEVAVIEASSFQLENVISFSPDIAVLLNIAPDHISRHGSMQKYIEAKGNIFLRQSEQDFAVYNADDPIVCELVDKCVAKKVPFSLTHPVEGGAYLSSGFVCFDGKPVVCVEDIDFDGKELENVLATVAVCMIKGISKFCISSAICDFSKPKYRRERVACIDGVTIFNDSKATNISACMSACESVGDCVLILGGMKGSEDFDCLFENLPKCVKHICVSGENSEDILESAKIFGFDNIQAYDNIKDALYDAYSVAKEGGISTILFSPSSKSFDKFASFEQRGAYFNDCVKALRVGR